MPNKIIEKDNEVSVRLDGAYVSGKNFFVTPFINDEGKERYFGKFRFSKPEEVKSTLAEAVKMLRKKNTGLADTIFGGQYPKWVEDPQYGKQLNAGNKVKFFREFGSKEEIAEANIEDYIYALEVHLSPTKSNDIFMRVVRAIAVGKLEGKYDDALFTAEDGLNVNEDDLPF